VQNHRSLPHRCSFAASWPLSLGAAYREKVVTINRRRFMLNSLGSVIAAPSLLSILMNLDAAHNASPSTARPRGSGRYGAWIEDEFALPAYR